MSEKIPSNQLSIGMPAGSLADPNRGGNLLKLLESAGFKTKGYEKGGPTEFTTTNLLFGWDGRPQEFGSQLGLEELDVAIAGDDWIKERQLELKMEYQTDVSLKRVLPLRRGGVRIVVIAKSDVTDIDEYLKTLCEKQDIISIVSEMPYLALDWVQTRLKELGKFDDFSNFSVQKYKTPAKIDKGIVIYETWGKTEAKVKNDGADLGVEITQTGSAIRNYGLNIVAPIMESETSIWINPSVATNPDKKELLNMFLINLHGAVNAENKVLVVFNVAKVHVEPIEGYLKENNLFADEPTINQGQDFCEYSIQIDTANPETPLAKVRYQLAKLQAKNIDTLPIRSAIPSLESIQI